MLLKIGFLAISMFLTEICSSQDLWNDVKKIDALVLKNDSIEKAGRNICDYVHFEYSDSDTTRRANHYIMDTINRILYKCIYDCTFNGLEEVRFYFHKDLLVKATVIEHQTNQTPFHAVYYFSGDSLLYQKEEGTSFAFRPWNVDRIKAQARTYFNGYQGICNYLDKRH